MSSSKGTSLTSAEERSSVDDIAKDSLVLSSLGLGKGATDSLTLLALGCAEEHCRHLKLQFKYTREYQNYIVFFVFFFLSLTFFNFQNFSFKI